MFAPKLYTVKKYPLNYIMEQNFKLDIDEETDRRFYIQQQDNLLFRQIRRITGDTRDFQRYITFVNCRGGKNHEAALSRLIKDGYRFHSTQFTMSERSASMTRNGILSFVDSSIEEELNKRVTLGIQIDKTVLSKYYAYRGLMLSSCHCLEEYLPKIIIVPDYYRTIPDQNIKYVYDKTTEFVDKAGKSRKWVQKDIAEKTTDIKINVFDGSGIHHPSISRKIEELLGSHTAMTSILWRAPYIKGVTNEMDYEAFYRERGVTELIDIWGTAHDFSEPMIIMTESMYKGKNYFQQYGDARDWEEYWKRFHQYEHCLGIAKWNYSMEEEPVYTRSNYQILQDLDLPYEDFASLAKYSIDWLERIIQGDRFYTYCFLGLTADSVKGLNPYTQSLLKNPEMLKEQGVRHYLITLLEKYRNEFKCGKLWLKSAFKFLVADPILFMEHAGGLEPRGCLEEHEFFSFNRDGYLSGEHLIERNPHICKSEHVILTGVTNPLLKRYCSHLANTCIVNGKSITPQRLNGADFDGDLVLVLQNDMMKRGVDRTIPIVIDTEDKITALEEADTKENRTALILRSMHSLIGETSNYATAYHNKTPKTLEQRNKYDTYIDLLSVINGKAIDFAKTGVLFPIPRNIAKYGRPLPYFMKYVGSYYAKLKEYSYAKSNLNRLCMELEKWEKTIRFQRTCSDFDYTIMMDSSISIPPDTFKQIEAIYLEFCGEMSQLGKEQAMIKSYDNYKEQLEGWISREDASQFEINWKYYYDSYQKTCTAICPDEKLLANIAVTLCYEKYPKKNKKFLWAVAGNGIIQNIRQVDFPLPVPDEQGKYEYLGKRYNLESKRKEVEDYDK